MRESSAVSPPIRARSPSSKSSRISRSRLGINASFAGETRQGSVSTPFFVSVLADICQEDSVIRTLRVLALLFFATMLPSVSRAQSPATPDRSFVVEYYYKAKWGHAEEFLKLFKKNHYPVLRKEMEMGRITKVWMDQPRYHTTEDGRWDFRVTIVFKNATLANEPFDEAALQNQMYPDQETFQREEQRRFEILDAHWDLPVKTVDLDAK